MNTESLKLVRERKKRSSILGNLLNLALELLEEKFESWFNKPVELRDSEHQKNAYLYQQLSKIEHRYFKGKFLEELYVMFIADPDQKQQRKIESLLEVANKLNNLQTSNSLDPQLGDSEKVLKLKKELADLWVELMAENYTLNYRDYQ